jgi:hypothetical protein
MSGRLRLPDLTFLSSVGSRARRQCGQKAARRKQPDGRREEGEHDDVRRDARSAGYCPRSLVGANTVVFRVALLDGLERLGLSVRESEQNDLPSVRCEHSGDCQLRQL